MEEGRRRSESASHVDLLRHYRAEIHFQHNTLNARLTTYVQSQAFLVAAYAVATNNSNRIQGQAFGFSLLQLLCGLGVTTSVLAGPGLYLACRVIGLWRKKRLIPLLRKYPYLHKYNDGRSMKPWKKLDIDLTHILSLTFATIIPIVFAGAWLLFYSVAVDAERKTTAAQSAGPSESQGTETVVPSDMCLEWW